MSDVTSAPPPLALRARGLHKKYVMGAQSIPILTGLDLDVAPGQVVSIVGTSGVGKSTLLNLLGLLDRPDSGSIEYDGVEVTRLGRRERARRRNADIGFIFQFYHLIPELSALENTLLPGMIRWRGGAWRGRRKAERARAQALLERMGLGPRLKHRPSELSGGERQRVAIARALFNEPRVLFCDEPTGNLDPHTAAEVEEQLFEMNDDGRGPAMVVVTHDVKLASRADVVLRMDEGTLVPYTDEVGPVAGMVSADAPSG